MTLNEVVQSTLKNSGTNFKMLKSNGCVARFVVECNAVKLHGTVTDEKYKWQIKKSDGTVIDESECSIKNTDDIINRIYENINTGNRLSKYVSDCNEARKNYLRPGYITEKEDTDDEDSTDTKRQLLLSDEDIVDVADDVEEFDAQTALDNIIQKSIDLASEITGVLSVIEDTEIEAKEDLLGLAGSFYGIADDIDDIIDELYPEEEMDESVKKTRKRVSITENKKILNKLAEVNSMIRNKPEYREIKEALKLIKSEIVLMK